MHVKKKQPLVARRDVGWQTGWKCTVACGTRCVKFCVCRFSAFFFSVIFFLCIQKKKCSSSYSSSCIFIFFFETCFFFLRVVCVCVCALKSKHRCWTDTSVERTHAWNAWNTWASRSSLCCEQVAPGFVFEPLQSSECRARSYFVRSASRFIIIFY